MNMWSLLGINLDPLFERKGSHPSTKSHHYKLKNLAAKVDRASLFYTVCILHVLVTLPPFHLN